SIQDTLDAMDCLKSIAKEANLDEDAVHELMKLKMILTLGCLQGFESEQDAKDDSQDCNCLEREISIEEIVDQYKLGYNLGNALNHLLLASKRNDEDKDLSKAVWYLYRELRDRSSLK